MAPAGLVSEPRGDLTCRGVEGPWKLYVLYEPEAVQVDKSRLSAGATSTSKCTAVAFRVSDARQPATPLQYPTIATQHPLRPVALDQTVKLGRLAKVNSDRRLTAEL